MPFDENILWQDAPLTRELTDDEVMEQEERLAAEIEALELSETIKATKMAKKVKGRKFPSDLVKGNSIDGVGLLQDPPIIVLPSEVKYSECAQSSRTQGASLGI